MDNSQCLSPPQNNDACENVCVESDSGKNGQLKQTEVNEQSSSLSVVTVDALREQHSPPQNNDACETWSAEPN